MYQFYTLYIYIYFFTYFNNIYFDCCIEDFYNYNVYCTLSILIMIRIKSNLNHNVLKGEGALLFNVIKLISCSFIISVWKIPRVFALNVPPFKITHSYNYYFNTHTPLLFGDNIIFYRPLLTVKGIPSWASLDPQQRWVGYIYGTNSKAKATLYHHLF